MKIEILYNFIPHEQIKKQNDVIIELNTRPTSPVWESKGFITLASTICEICDLLRW